MTAVFYDIYLFSISTLFKILEWATSSYVGSVLKKTCQKLATVDKGFNATKPLPSTQNLASSEDSITTLTANADREE